MIPLPALGIDLLASETKLPEGTVREADNVDITSEGVYSRRKGSTLSFATAEAHSLHKTPRGVLVGIGATLYAIAGGSLQAVCPLVSAAPLDFTEYNGHTYFTNGSLCAWIPSNEASARRVGASLPDVLPALSITSGTLDAGLYSIGLTRVDDRGEESGMKVLGQVNLLNGGGILLTGLQVDLSCQYRAYITPANGDTFYLSEEFSGAFAQFAVTRKPDGAQPTSRFLAPMPAGTFIRGYAGRLYVAKGDTLWYSEALRPHLTDPRHNFIKFVGEIKFVEALAGGLYVGDSRGVWFLTGLEPSQFAQRFVSSAEPVKRSSLVLPGTAFKPDLAQTSTELAVWLSTEGYMLGRPDGQVTALHPERIRVAAGLEGRSRFVVRDGNKQIITLVAATTASGFGVAIDTTLQ